MLAIGFATVAVAGCSSEPSPLERQREINNSHCVYAEVFDYRSTSGTCPGDETRTPNPDAVVPPRN